MTNYTPMLLLAAACVADPLPPPTPPLGPSATAVAFGDGRFVLLRNHVALDGFGLGIETSTDGASWHEVARIRDTGAQSGGVAFANGRFIVVASELQLSATGQSIRRSAALTSTDGTTWTRVADPPDATSGIAAIGTTFIAASKDGLVTTTDGTSWSAPVPGAGNLWWAPLIATVGDRVFAFGDGPSVLESTDGIAWAGADTGLSVVHSIAEIDGAIVGYGLYDCCFGEKPDGITNLELHRLPTAWSLTAIDYEGWRAQRDLGDVVVATGDAQIVTTTDGVSYVGRASAELGVQPTIASDDAGTVVIAGYDLAVSHDRGTTWQVDHAR